VSALLRVKGLEGFYGSTRVLHGIDLEVGHGGVTAILGANGAGKTTMLRAISALIRTRGEVWLRDRRIDGLPTEAIAALGVAHVPDGRGTLGNFTVEDNLRVGAYLRRDRVQVRADIDLMYAYFPCLHERRASRAATLSGGEQQMLAIARALMLRPSLLLLDEPSLGLAPLVMREIFDILRRINREECVSILLVEQNVAYALELADRGWLIESGRTVMSGNSQELRDNEKIRHSYLGGQGI
jgi:branched-chain amino acid transport system ATP-binding protein